MQFVHVLESNNLQFIYCLRPFRDFNHHTVTSNNHHFSSKTCNAVLNSPSLSVLVMIEFFSVSFNASTPPSCLLHYKECMPLTPRWLLLDRVTNNVIVRNNLFSLFIRSEHRKSFFVANIGRIISVPNIRSIPSVMPPQCKNGC